MSTLHPADLYETLEAVDPSPALVALVEKLRAGGAPFLAGLDPGRLCRAPDAWPEGYAPLYGASVVAPLLDISGERVVGLTGFHARKGKPPRRRGDVTAARLVDAGLITVGCACLCIDACPRAHCLAPTNPPPSGAPSKRARRRRRNPGADVRRLRELRAGCEAEADRIAAKMRAELADAPPWSMPPMTIAPSHKRTE